MATHHETLGVAPNASEAEIKAAYRRLVLLCHPDRCRELQAAMWFNDITTAYRALMARVPCSKAEKDKPKQSPPQRNNADPDDIHLIVRLSPADLRNGSHKRIRFARFDPCPDCGGRRSASFCTNCRGSGEVTAEVTVRVKIPAGVKDGTVLRLRGAGHMREGGRSGDVWMRVRMCGT